MENKQKQMCGQYFFTDNKFMLHMSWEFNWLCAVISGMLCVSVFDPLGCLVCLLSQLGYVAGFQTEHVLV